MGTRFTKEDIRTPDEDGITPMYIAAQKNTVEALQWLFDHGAQEDVLHIRGIQEIIGEFVRGISQTSVVSHCTTTTMRVRMMKKKRMKRMKTMMRRRWMVV